jgi:aminoglycoside phosphotransferase (APT) family kinase protein
MGRPVPDLGGAVEDRQGTFEAISIIARDMFGASAGVKGISVERLERRLLQYSVDLESGQSWLVIGKVYGSTDEGQRGFDAMRRLWQAGFSERAPVSVRIPQPYRYLPDLRLLLMEYAPGEMLRKLVKQKRAGTGEMHSFAAALAKLHRSPLVVAEPFGVERHLAIRCAGLHESVAEAFPELRDRVRWIVETARALELHGDSDMRLVHGDFHLGQIHVHGPDAWILDLDPLHAGDPAYDLAMVFVMLKHLEQRTGDTAYIRSLRDAFLAAYLAETDDGLAARVPLHMALIHLKRACKRFRWQDEPGWPDIVRRQIGESAACMEAATRLTALSGGVDALAEIYNSCPASL